MNTQEGRKKFYPNEENLGNNCMFWVFNESFAGCTLPKLGLRDRTSCEGIIDDVCLYEISGREPRSLTDSQIIELKTTRPRPGRNPELPPGDIY